MYTVGQLIRQLATLDPTTPVGIIDIDRYPRSQRATISLRDIVDIDVVHDAANGKPQSVWLSAQPASAGELPAAPTTGNGATAILARTCQNRRRCRCFRYRL